VKATSFHYWTLGTFFYCAVSGLDTLPLRVLRMITIQVHPVVFLPMPDFSVRSSYFICFSSLSFNYSVFPPPCTGRRQPFLGIHFPLRALPLSGLFLSLLGWCLTPIASDYSTAFFDAGLLLWTASRLLTMSAVYFDLPFCA